MPRYIILIGLILSLSIASFSAGLVAAPNYSASQVEAQQAIETAQTTINDAFGQITQADLAGADISDLVSALNLAISDLDLARAAFSASEYASTTLLAESAQNAAEAVLNEAQTRVTVALTNSIIQVLLILVVIIAVVVFTYLLITRWRKHKQQQTRTLLRMEIHLPREEERDE